MNRVRCDVLHCDDECWNGRNVERERSIAGDFLCHMAIFSSYCIGWKRFVFIDICMYRLYFRNEIAVVKRNEYISILRIKIALNMSTTSENYSPWRLLCASRLFLKFLNEFVLISRFVYFSFRGLKKLCWIFSVFASC